MGALENPTDVGRPRRRRWWAWIGVAAMLATMMLLPVHGTTAVAQSNPGVEFLGELDTRDREGGIAGVLVAGINQETRRLYTIGSDGGDRWIAEYDLETEVPTLLRMTEKMLPPLVRAGPSSAVFDPPNERMFLLSIGRGTVGERLLIEVDLATLTSEETGEAEIMRGFVAKAITYSSERDRLYLVGSLEGNTNISSSLGVAQSSGPATVVVALDGQTLEVEWYDHVESCGDPLFNSMTGALVGLSSQRPMLYWFCRAAKTANSRTGNSGLVQLDIEDGMGASGPSDFPMEFFPVSGDYGDGTAVFDPDRERFIVQSQSDRTHGAWVFDGLRSSWIGFVAAPDNTNVFTGIDPATGKHYMLGGTDTFRSADFGYVNITDGSATPVPQGRLFEDFESSRGVPVPHSDVAIDPETGRMFYGAMTTVDVEKRNADGEVERNEDGEVVYVQEDQYYWVALRDTTPPITPRDPLDLDELTHDLPDDEARLEFSANTSGFGAQYTMVGGWETVYENITPPDYFGSNPAPTQFNENPANLRYGNRGATMAFVDRMGISSSGSSATAIASRPDDKTPADAETKTNQATEPVGGVPSVPGDGEESDNGQSDGEAISHASCLDGIGEPVTDEEGSEEQPAYAAVTCDLDALETTGYAKFSDRTGGGPMSVGSSSFDARTYRDPERGVVTETVATAEGVAFGEVGVGGVTVDRVTSTATTWAKGLDGESHVRWVRTVEGARTFGADGTASEGESCTTIVESGEETVEEGDCKSLAQDLNELFPQRYEVKFPLPEVVATPGGAFASVQETETDFLSGQATNNDDLRVIPGMEVTVYRDGPQRGRLVTQMAAVSADTTFIRSPIQGFEPFDTSTGDDSPAPTDEGGTTEPATGQEGDTEAVEVPDSGETTVAAPETTEQPEVAEESGVVLASHEARLVGGFGWLPALRSVGDAILIGALYLVFLLPVAEIVRRRRLLDVLADGAPADDSSLPVSSAPVRSTS